MEGSEESEFKCDECVLTFETTDCVKIHIGEVHMEDELIFEVAKLFPTNFKCSQCNEVSESEYEKKEHILLHHPWPQLLTVLSRDRDAQVKESENGETGEDNSNKTSKVSS